MKPNRLQARGVTRVPSARCGQRPVKLRKYQTWYVQILSAIFIRAPGSTRQTSVLTETSTETRGGGQPQYSGNMCHTKGERSSWLAIDYGTPVIVQRVEIFNRDDCCGGRTKNVEVWISNHLLKTRNLLGTFVGPAADGQLITISGWRIRCSNPLFPSLTLAGGRTKIHISGLQDVGSNSV